MGNNNNNNNNNFIVQPHNKMGLTNTNTKDNTIISHQ